MCVMAERDIDPVADILVAIVFQGKKDYVKNTTHNMQRHVTGYLQSTPGKLHLPKWACLQSRCDKLGDKSGDGQNIDRFLIRTASVTGLSIRNI